jgi:hypothetical protein
MKLAARSRQRGIIMLAFVLLLLVIASAALLNRANRMSPSDALANTNRAALGDLLNALKPQLIAKAANEDNTPGAMPCPTHGSSSSSSSAGSCVVSASALAGNFSIAGLDTAGAIKLSLPAAQTSPLCIQYALAPSLRNILSTDTRGSTQARINPGFSPDLIVVDSAGRSTKAWAALLSNMTAGVCSIASLGYQLDIAGNTATLSPIPGSDGSTAISIIQTRDILAALFTQVLQSMDIPSFQSYLQSNANGIASLSSIRAKDPAGFDAAISPGATLSNSSSSGSSSSSNACLGVTTTSASSSISTTYKTPVSWLCFNDWYSYVDYDKTTSILRATDSTSGLKCLRQSGKTTCTY